jgi:cbb3-type cytochrome oxidase maturation protein
MNILIYLIPIALFLGLFGLGAFLWALKNKQFEDLEGAANRILFDDLLDKESSDKKIEN